MDHLTSLLSKSLPLTHVVEDGRDAHHIHTGTAPSAASNPFLVRSHSPPPESTQNRPFLYDDFDSDMKKARGKPRSFQENKNSLQYDNRHHHNNNKWSGKEKELVHSKSVSSAHQPRSTSFHHQQNRQYHHHSDQEMDFHTRNQVAASQPNLRPPNIQGHQHSNTSANHLNPRNGKKKGPPRPHHNGPLGPASQRRNDFDSKPSHESSSNSTYANDKMKAKSQFKALPAEEEKNKNKVAPAADSNTREMSMHLKQFLRVVDSPQA